MQLILGFHVDLCEAVHEDACFRVFTEFEILSRLGRPNQGSLRTHPASDRGVRGGLLVVGCTLKVEV